LSFVSVLFWTVMACGARPVWPSEGLPSCVKALGAAL
jgi:hypothetical protein